MNRRRTGQMAAAVIAVAAFAWAAWSAHVNAMPEFRVYDGYWMILGATVAVAIVAPMVWRWRREWSLVAVTVAAAVGSVIPLLVSALRHGLPIPVRLRGAWILGGADAIGPALVLGYLCLWFAVREYSNTSAGREAPRQIK
jgi:hypothetical protein